MLGMAEGSAPHAEYWLAGPAMCRRITEYRTVCSGGRWQSVAAAARMLCPDGRPDSTMDAA